METKPKTLFLFLILYSILLYLVILVVNNRISLLEGLRKFVMDKPYQKRYCIDLSQCPIKGVPRQDCNCNGRRTHVVNGTIGLGCSTCSYEATLQGLRQRVVSFSLSDDYSSNETISFKNGLIMNLKDMREHYPGWVMRIYSNMTLTPGNDLCQSICDNQEDLYWCDVTRIPDPLDTTILFDFHTYGSTLWRFLPLNDPLVSIFLSRDLDAVLGPRERKAVKEWEARKDKAIHLMRDHPEGHKRPVLAGRCGIKTGMLKKDEKKGLENRLFKKSVAPHLSTNENDMITISQALYDDTMFPHILAHDSFFCWVFNETECKRFPDGKWSWSIPKSVRDNLVFEGEVNEKID